MANTFVQRDMVARIAPNIVKHATVVSVYNTRESLDLMRECDECCTPQSYYESSIDYADFIVDFGNNEKTYKCKQHLIDADKRMAALS